MLPRNEIQPKMPAALIVRHDKPRGLLSVEHDGSITWDELQTIKNEYWGAEAVAIEIYPPDSHVVNSAPIRHLWLLGPSDWWPDLTGRKPHGALSLRDRDLLVRLETGLFSGSTPP